MPSIEIAINLFNAYWKSALWGNVRFANGLIAGLAHKCIGSEQSNADKVFPVIYQNGEPFNIGLDDTYPIIVYHRQASPARYERTTSQFGDGDNTVRRVISMRMVVFGKRSVLDLTPENLETMIILASPTNAEPSDLVGTSIDNLSLEITGSDMDAQTVFGEEYSGIEYPISPDEFLFKIEYNLGMEFRKDCIDPCDCITQ